MIFVPIEQIDGAPDHLIEAINDRLRRLTMSAAEGGGVGAGIPGPPGPRGSQGPAGDAGGTGAPDAPPATIGTVTVREVYGGRFEVTIPWTAGAGPPTTGVQVYVEDPDISALLPAKMDDTVPLNGVSGVSGKWAPRRASDDFESPAVIEVKGEPAARDIRIYVQAFGSAQNPTLVRANQPNPTPNAIAHIPVASGAYVSGQEYAWLVTNAGVQLVEDFENPNGPKYHLIFDYTPPDDSIPLPPGLRPFGGVQTVYEYDDGKRTQAVLLEVKHQEDWHSGDYDAYTGTFKVWFCSRDIDGNVNSIVKGVTPMKEVTVVYPPEGEGSAPDITDFVLSNPRYESQPDYTILSLADLSWTAPDSPRFAEVHFYRTGVTPPRRLQDAGKLINHLTLQIVDWSKTAEDWTIVAISMDYNGHESDDPASPKPSTPRVIWHMVPPSADSNATGVIGITGVTITTEQEQNSDGIVMMRHKITGWTNPTDNTFGGASIARAYGSDLANGTAVFWNAPKNVTTFTTDWEPAPSARTWAFYFVSRDGQDRRNPIIPGLTPMVSHAFVPALGNVIPSRIPGSWWNEAEFTWPAGDSGKFTALEFVAKKIFVGSILRVGGGNATGSTDPSFKGQENGQIAVYNSANILRAWMGQKTTGTPDTPSAHSVYGGWFTELYIGGDSPVNAPIYATQAGQVIIGGFDVSGANYPYISLRNKFGTEMGRLGARIGWTQGGVESTIEGAWFREFAYGGQSFSDWKMLAKMDATDPKGATVTMRNVTNFSIDYDANTTYFPGNPSNVQTHLEFGLNAYVADAIGNPSYFKFPGFKIVKTGTTFGSVLINRGLVMKNAAGDKMGALVMYNGDGFGNDSGNGGVFWAELSLYSPTSHQINAHLSSGSVGNYSSFFTLRDSAGTLNFNVDQAGAVTVRSTLTVNGTGTSLFTAGGINCSGQITTNSQTIFCGALNAGTGNGNFGIVYCNYVNAQGSLGVNTGTFTTADGKTVTVRGGVIVGLA